MQSSTVLIGNLVADPELKFLNDGTAKATVSIAVNEYWTDKQNQRQEKTSYLNLVAWRQIAEDLCRIGTKGLRVIAVAKPEQRSWEDTETGKKRSTVEFVISEIGPSARGVETIERKAASENSSGGTRRPQSTATGRGPATKKAEIFEEEPF